MAENLVATSKSTQSRLASLEAGIAALLSQAGIITPKTTARASTKSTQPSFSNVSHSSRGRKGRVEVEPVVIEVKDSDFANRMRLPAKMFTKGNKVVVDGHVFTQQAQDGGRSSKFQPDVFGDVDAGDSLVFTHNNGREWDVEIQPAGRKAKKAKSVPKAETRNTSKTAKTAKSKAPKSSDDNAPRPTTIRAFADLCIENAEDPDFEENANIKTTAAFDTDARVFLTTRQSQQFRSWRKRKGLTLRKAVEMLNNEVYED